jgi:hypothetical protein
MDESISKDVTIDPTIDGLLTKFAASRDALEVDLSDITELKEHMGTLFPKDINFRNKFVLEEKIKASTSFYSTMLSIRQEINRSLSKEIDIRRVLNVKSNDMGGIDIRKLADELEALEKSGNKDK